MKFQFLKFSLFVFCFLFTAFLWAQEGTLKGILNGDDGLAMPGVNVTVKNTNQATSTDLDGMYRIKCRVGDIVVFSAVGMKTREVYVTTAMLGDKSSEVVEMIPVKKITSDAYQKRVAKNRKTKALHHTSSKHKYQNKPHVQYHRIHDITVQDKEVKLTYFKPDVFFEVGYTANTGVQFVKRTNLPELQNTYSQGVSLNGVLTFQGPETGNTFSYGSRVSNLEFDGSNYAYDRHGKLVAIGNGNGQKATKYNNQLFQTSLISSNHFYLNINRKTSLLRFNYSRKTESDIFNIENSHANDFTVKYTRKQYATSKVGWNTFVNYNNQLNNQPNFNGFLNNLVLNNAITPITFNNKEAIALQDGTQRSFAPSSYNNTNWLLENHNNSEKKTNFTASIQNTFKASGDIIFKTKLNYSSHVNKQLFGLPKNTVGFEQGYSSSRAISKKDLNGILNFEYHHSWYGNSIAVVSKTDYEYQDLKYSLDEFSGLDNFSTENATNQVTNTEKRYRNKLRLLNKVTYSLDDVGLKIGLTNNSYISSLQNDKWFLPTLQLKIDVRDLFNFYDLPTLLIAAGFSLDVNDTRLFYHNNSHNSLAISPNESLQYLATNDLFLNASLALEDKKSYDINVETDFRLSDVNFDFGITYFNTTTKNLVLPVLEGNAFELKNTAAILNQGIEATLSAQFYFDFTDNFYYEPTFTFSTNRTKVLELTNELNHIAIAGFNTTSKQLIVGQPAGVIVGSAYARDENNNLIIGDNGFPIVAQESKIIGDPTPKFNLSYSNKFSWKDISLSFIIDTQKGGDVWNGTQNVLNYFGASQQSAAEREITNYVFTGVNQQGEVNTNQVAFFNPENDISENRFVRYGFEGVAEEAIEDGSYINIKSIDLTYTPIKRKKSGVLQDLSVGLYGYNLITWSKFKGASPYSNLYDHGSGSGLNFFNTPLISEVGFKVNLKI